MGHDVRSGVGCERDQALASGKRRFNIKNYNNGIDRESAMIPLTLNEMFGHRDFVQGDLVSITDGKIVPLDPALPFAGIIGAIGEDRGRYVASVSTRGAICVRVRGLNMRTPQGAKVYAMPAGRTQTLNLAGEGILVGEVCAIESAEREMAIVGFRQPNDRRPFWLSGPRPSRN